MRYRVWAYFISTLLTSAVCAQLAFANDYKPKPIPNGPAAYTWKDFYKVAKCHNDRVFVGSYKTMGKRDSKWDAAALLFLDGYVQWYTNAGEKYDFAAVVKQGQAAVDGGCDDPIILTCLGHMTYVAGKYADADTFLRRGLEGFQKNIKLSRDIARLAPLYLLYAHSDASDLMPADREVWRKLAIKWTAESTSDGSYLPDETRVMYKNIFIKAGYNALKDLRPLYEALKSLPNSNAYFTQVVGGQLEVREAWDARGTQYSYAVTDDGQKGFATHLKIACKLLTQAWKLHPDHPEAPTAMINVAMGGYANPNDTVRMWFDRAVAAQMDYDDAYNRMENALLPRWGGSVQELYDFGVDCLNTKRYDTHVPFMFHWLLHLIQSEQDGRWTYWDKSETAAHLAQLYDGSEKYYVSNNIHQDPSEDQESSRNHYHFQSLRAATAWYCGRNNEAKQLIAVLGDKLQTSVFLKYFHTPYDTAKKTLDKGILMGVIPQNPINGHYYEIRHTPPISWTQANLEAQRLTYKGLGGHLATITSSLEGEFIESRRIDDSTCWIGGSTDAKGWHWVTGESWSYSKLPNSSDKAVDENYLAAKPNQQWVAMDKNGKAGAYVVEYQ